MGVRVVDPVWLGLRGGHVHSRGQSIGTGEWGRHGRPGHSTPDFSLLTKREVEVLLLLADGESNRSLARQLNIAERTVRAHVTSLMRKLGARSRVEAALMVYNHRNALTAEAA
ncbi:response regulator transcription factor [Streptomyces buecherae]|uniref:Response regulator transcription factor n=2 Tax=Streptomyces buecherae TaxID=2763006 RepID=A0A7H8NBT9_9ACTN|nr:response regulator transcription factor [Streptomyces buecherae]MBC3983407.1 response regulator transcription factor [Streptomyces buecherae]MBC3992946.1 response regulator transcription factor [Streptomyces buecherae]QKW51885.1 response regulator transcription factor [Streptomyces buecherae]QNJ40592.1 response regulator transcription factor [Streptomyces buecherae]